MKRTLLSAFLVTAFLLPVWPQLFPKKTVVHAEATGNRRKASSDLKHKVNSGRGNDRVRVIIQPVNSWNTTLESTVQNSGGSNERQFQNFRLRAVTISAKAALELANRQDIAYVSLNREVRTLGHVSVTTGADAVRTWNCSTIDGVDGTGIGIAVLDSGIDADHTSFNNGSNPRVIASQDFTGEGRTDDPYGHGTHVASIAAGNGRVSDGEYLGIAPNANIINLRVLNSEGVGFDKLAPHGARLGGEQSKRI
jgi:serine protease AprX